MPLEIFAPDATSTPLAREASGALRLQAEVTYTVVGEPGELDALSDGLPPKVGQRRAVSLMAAEIIEASAETSPRVQAPSRPSWAAAMLSEAIFRPV